jgi:hypothetical protein
MRRLGWMPIVLIFSGSLLAQSQIHPCPLYALDTSFQAMDGADFSYTLVINLRNVSRVTCSVSTYADGAHPSPHEAPDGSMVRICYYCEEGAQKPAVQRMNLAPGESVHQVTTWKIAPENGATAHCIYPKEMMWGDVAAERAFWLASPSLLKPICSPLVITNYVPGKFLSDAREGLPEDSRAPLIRWANDENLSYPGERIPLRVIVEDPGKMLWLNEHSCPRLLLRVRDVTPTRNFYSHSVRVEELQEVTCKVEAAGGAARRFAMEFEVTHAIKPQEMHGEYTINVSSLILRKGRFLLSRGTEGLQLSMIDNKFIRRNWGSRREGAEVSVTLDKDLFPVGSDIRLHIAVQNVDSYEELFAMDPVFDPPGVAVGLEADGYPIPAGGEAIWTGHGFCHEFPRGVVFPIELTLSQMGFKPEAPGVYKVWATWGPSKDGGCANGPPGSMFAVKSTPVIFRVVAESNEPAPK